MHDIKFIRQDREAFDAGMKRRGLPPQAEQILKIDEEDRAMQTQLQELQSKRNAVAKQIGMAKAKGEDVSEIMETSRQLNEVLMGIEQKLKSGGLRDQLLAQLPNIPADDVPQGKDEKDNKKVREWGEPKKFPFKAKEHFELGENLYSPVGPQMDFVRAANLSGARFVVLQGALARMERALVSFFLDMNVAAGYTEVVPPLIVKDEAAYGTGQLPKFRNDLFAATNIIGDIDYSKGQQTSKSVKFNEALLSEEDQKVIAEAQKQKAEFKLVYRQGDNEWEPKCWRFEVHRWLVPTAEVPLTNLVMNTILEGDDWFPMRMTAYTPCFRSEAGAAGKDTRGMIRQHQFSKVELVSITHPDKSKEEHERMTAQAESLLQKLGLPYRTMLLCTGDMGFSSEKTYDIEVWLPGQGAYREISSCSNCGAFQARRMKARFKSKAGKGNEFVHTLNGSGLPIGRTMIAIMENYQQADGSITVPEALRPYMGGLEIIK